MSTKGLNFKIDIYAQKVQLQAIEATVLKKGSSEHRTMKKILLRQMEPNILLS